MTSAFHILILFLFVAISLIGSVESLVSERLENDRKWKLKYEGSLCNAFFFFHSLCLPISLAF